MMTQIIPDGTMIEYEDDLGGYHLGWVVESLRGSGGGIYGYTLKRLNGGTIPRPLSEVRYATIESDLATLDII